MKKLLMIMSALCILPLTSYAAETYSPEGLWLTENQRSAIRVEECDKGLCGRIAWIIEGGMQKDSKNPQLDLRNQPMCGLEIMHSFSQSDSNPNAWEGGKIYKADEGDIYNASAIVKSENEMTVRGYLGISLFGKSQTWNRVNANDYPKCKPAK